MKVVLSSKRNHVVSNWFPRRRWPPSWIFNFSDFVQISNNVVLVELTISMYFQQFEDLKFLIFSRGACPRTSLKPMQSVQLSQIRQECPDSTWEPRIPTQLQSGQGEYPDFEDQLSQACKQRNILLSVNCHTICDKMKKTLNLDIQVNSELESWWMMQKLHNKIT